MIENYDETSHGLQGPHWKPRSDDTLPIDFAPLRLHVRNQGNGAAPVTIEVCRQIALVGRHSCADVRLAYPDVSRRHCRLNFKDGVWRIVDLNSLNGLYVNGERIHEAVLQRGDVIRIGNVTLAVRTEDDEMAYPLNGILRSIADNLG